MPKNAYELKIQEYQNKIQAMVDEKGHLVDRIDEIYSKYLDQNILQTQTQGYKQSELENHIENLKQKLKQEIDGRHGISPSRLMKQELEGRQMSSSRFESSILRQMNSNSMLQRNGSANSQGKDRSLMKKSARGSQANMENSLLNTYLDSN